jgi:hypothetical protein
MKVDVYGKPYDQACQNAVGLLKSAKIKVRFHNIDLEHNKNKLIHETKELQKNSSYKFRSLSASPLPIVISDDTMEVLVGYDRRDTNPYSGILKQAGVKELDDFVNKYPEWKKKNAQSAE